MCAVNTLNASNAMEKSRLPLFGRAASSSKKKKQTPTSRSVNPVAAAFSDATAMGMADVSVSNSSRRYQRDNSLVSTFVSHERKLGDGKSPPPKSSVRCFSDTNSSHGAGQETPHVIISSDQPCYPVSVHDDNTKADPVGRTVHGVRNGSSVTRVICSTEQSQPTRGHRSPPDRVLQSPSLRGSVADTKPGVGNQAGASIPIMCRGSPLPLRRQDGTGGDQRTSACLVKPHRSYSNPEDRRPTIQTPNTGHMQHQSLSAKRGRSREKPTSVNDTSNADGSMPVVVVRRDRLYSYPEDTECDEPVINGDHYNDSPPQLTKCPPASQDANRTSKDNWTDRVTVAKHQSPQPVNAGEKQCLSLAGLSPNCDCKTNIYESMPPSPIYETIDQVYVRAFPKTVSTAFVSPCCGVRMAELRATKRVSCTRSHSASPEPHSLVSPPPLPPRNPGTKISYGGGEQQASPEGLQCIRSSVRTSKMQYVGDSPETVFPQGSSGRPSPVGQMVLGDQFYSNTQTCLQSEQSIWDCKGTNEEEFSQQPSPGWGDDHSQTEVSPVYTCSTKRNVGKESGVGALQQNLPDLVNVIEIVAQKQESGKPQYRNVPKKQLPQRAREAHANSKNLSSDANQVSKSQTQYLGSSDRKPITVIRDTTIHDGPQTRKTVHVTAAERCDVESKIKRFEGDDSSHRDRSGSRGKYDHQPLSTSSICNKWLAASKLKSVRHQTGAVTTAAMKQNGQQVSPEISPASNKPQGLVRAPSKSKLQYSEQQSRLSRSRQCIAKAKSRTAPVDGEMVKKEGSRLPSGVRVNDKLGSTRQLARKQPRQPRGGQEDMMQSTSSNEPCSSVTSSCTSLASVFSENNNASSRQDPRRPRVLKGRSSRAVPPKGYSEMTMDKDSGVAGKVMHDAQKPSKPVHVKQSRQHKITKLPMNRSGSFSDLQSCNSNASSRSQSVKSKQIRPVATGRIGARAGGGSHDGLGIDPVLDRCAYSEEKVKNWSCVPESPPQQPVSDATGKTKGTNIQRRQISSRMSQQSKLPPRPVRAECTSPPASVTSVGTSDTPCASQTTGMKPPRDTTPVRVSPSANSQTADFDRGSVNGASAPAKKQVSYSTKLAKVSRLKPPGGAKKSVTAEDRPLARQDGGGGDGDNLAVPGSPKSHRSAGATQSQISVKHRRKLAHPDSIHGDCHGDDDTGSCSSWGSTQPDLTKHSPECGLMLVKPYSVKNRRQHQSRGVLAKTKSFENDAADDVETVVSTCTQEPRSCNNGNNDGNCEPTVEVAAKYNICLTATELTSEKQSQPSQTRHETGNQHEHTAQVIARQSDCQANSPEIARTVVSTDKRQDLIQQCDGQSGNNCTRAVSTHGENVQRKNDKPTERRCVSATETNTKTSTINKADVCYHLGDQVSSRLAGASSAATAISDITTKAAAMTPVLLSTVGDCLDSFTDRSSDAVGRGRLDSKDTVDCSYQDDKKLDGHLPGPMAVQSGKSDNIRVIGPDQCTDVSYRNDAPTCVEKNNGGQQFVYNATSLTKPPVDHVTYLETSLINGCDKAQGSTESLTGHHEEGTTKVKDVGQASSDLLGNIKLSESGYDSWKSQGSNSTTCGRDELIEIDVASWGIFDDRGETLIHMDGAKKTTEELPFVTRRVRGRVCNDACPSASLSGSEDTLTPERLVDGNDFGSDLGSSIGVFGDSTDWIGPKDQSTAKITRKTDHMKPAVCSVEQATVPLPTNCVATEMVPGVAMVTSQATDAVKQELTAVDMLFSNMYSKKDNGNEGETEKGRPSEHNDLSPVSSDLFETNGNDKDAEVETTPVRLRRPKPKQSRPAQRPDTLFPSTPRHSRIIENTELQALSSSSCDIDDHNGDNPWPSQPSPTWKNKRHSAILSPGRVTRPVSLSSSSPSLETVEQEGEQHGLLAYISTSYLLDEGSLRRSTATSSLNMQRKEEAEELIVETAVSETSLHVQPSEKDSGVRGIDLEMATEKSKIEAVSTTPMLVDDKPCKVHDVSVSCEKPVTCDVVKAHDSRASHVVIDKKDSAIRSLSQPAVINGGSVATETGPQPPSGHGACLSNSAPSDSVVVSPSLQSNTASKSKLQTPSSHHRVSKLRPVTSVKANTTVKPAEAAGKHSTKDKETASSGISFQSVMGSLRQATVTLYRRTSSHASSPTRGHDKPSSTPAHKPDTQQKLPTGIATKSPSSSGIPSPGKNVAKQSKLSSFSPKMQPKSGIPGKAKKSSSTSDAPPSVCEKLPLKCSQSNPSGRHTTGKNGESAGLGHESQIPPRSPAKTSQDSRTPPASGIATKVGLSRISRPVHPRLGPGKSTVKLPRSSASEDKH